MKDSPMPNINILVKNLDSAQCMRKFFQFLLHKQGSSFLRKIGGQKISTVVGACVTHFPQMTSDRWPKVLCFFSRETDP